MVDLLQAASNTSFISVIVFSSFIQNLIVYHCSSKFLDFSSLIFLHAIFKEAVSGFHEINKNTPNTIK